MFHIRDFSLRHWIIVYINDLVKILGDSLNNLMKLYIVIRLVIVVGKS